MEPEKHTAPSTDTPTSKLSQCSLPDRTRSLDSDEKEISSFKESLTVEDADNFLHMEEFGTSLTRTQRLKLEHIANVMPQFKIDPRAEVLRQRAQEKLDAEHIRVKEHIHDRFERLVEKRDQATLSEEEATEFAQLVDAMNAYRS